MWVVFADDSEIKRAKDVKRRSLGHLVGLGAVLFPEDALVPFRDRMVALRAELGVPPDVELKWSPDDGSWLKTDEGNAIRTQLRQRMLALGAELGARSITVVWDRGHLAWEEDRTRAVVLKYLYDKVSMCLKAMGDGNRAIIVADEPGGGTGDQKAWLASTRPLTSDGTAYSPPDHIVLPILVTQSHHVPHMQLADLVAGATVAAIAGNRFALALVPDLMKLIHRNNWGYAGGAGLTVWPPELNNLYFHICGDDGYARNGVGVTLPWKDWEFASDDGLASPVEVAVPSPPSAPTT